MKEEVKLWNAILEIANGRDSILRAELKDVLETYNKDVWKILFDEEAVGFENEELVIDVPRGTLYPDLVKITDF